MWTHSLYLCRVTCVTPSPRFSAQTLSVLAALCDQPSQWQHGYALAKQTGLASVTGALASAARATATKAARAPAVRGAAVGVVP